jgi:hypothetical protein
MLEPMPNVAEAIAEERCRLEIKRDELVGLDADVIVRRCEVDALDVSDSLTAAARRAIRVAWVDAAYTAEAIAERLAVEDRLLESLERHDPINDLDADDQTSGGHDEQ